LRLFDVDGSFEEEIIPGVAVRLSNAHTAGSVSVLIETDEGIANICGDIIYDVRDQLEQPHLDLNFGEPTVTANHMTSMRAEKTAIKKALSGSRFLLPSHDVPVLLSHGRVVGRLEDALTNPKAKITNAAAYTSAAVISSREG
jgi:glyoxylase-like metal-dependent hydrolase (beta-lactamase superfamily II)